MWIGALHAMPLLSSQVWKLAIGQNINQGIVYLPADSVNDYKPGDIIKILPVHSCTTANLMKEYLTVDGRKIKMML